MAIVIKLYDESENPVLQKLKEMDRKRAERVIASFYENEEKKIKKLLRPTTAKAK